MQIFSNCTRQSLQHVVTKYGTKKPGKTGLLYLIILFLYLLYTEPIQMILNEINDQLWRL